MTNVILKAFKFDNFGAGMNFIILLEAWEFI